jgi:hypothetical protein
VKKVCFLVFALLVFGVFTVTVFTEKSARVVILGDVGVDKTRLVKGLARDPFGNEASTMGYN